MRKVYRYLPDGRTVVTYRSERPTMLKTYRITFRSEVFIQAPDAAAAQLAFEAGDAGEESEYVEQSSGPEEYSEPFGTPIEGGDDE